MAILEVRNIEKHFGATRVLEDISFQLERGQALAIIGSSGSGKTTLLRCLNFLETPNKGSIVVEGNTIFYNYKSIPYALEIVGADVHEEVDHISIIPTNGTCNLIPQRAKMIEKYNIES